VTIDRHLLDIACCPVTRQPLQLMPEAMLARLNARIDQGLLRAVGGDQVGQRLDEALMTRDGRLAYPVRDGIPVLLEERGIPLGQLE
jgi:uncharacterized protein YbaR (Trm112 family)